MQIHPPKRGTFFKQTPPLERGDTLPDKETNELVISIPDAFLVHSRRHVCARVRERDKRMTEGRCGDGRVWAPVTFAMMTSMSKNKIACATARAFIYLPGDYRRPRGGGGGPRK